jgi:hypothetical protein
MGTQSRFVLVELIRCYSVQGAMKLEAGCDKRKQAMGLIELGGWMDRYGMVDGWMDGRMAGWMDG